jgi:hypothetical protein
VPDAVAAHSRALLAAAHPAESGGGGAGGAYGAYGGGSYGGGSGYGDYGAYGGYGGYGALPDTTAYTFVLEFNGMNCTTLLADTVKLATFQDDVRSAIAVGVGLDVGNIYIADVGCGSVVGGWGRVHGLQGLVNEWRPLASGAHRRRA